jgi:hypothetical protein
MDSAFTIIPRSETSSYVIARTYPLEAFTSIQQTKKGAPNQGRPRNPDQGAHRTAPGRRSLDGSAVQVPLRCFKGLAAQVGRFPRSSNLTPARRSNCHHGRNAGRLFLPRSVAR